MLQNIQLSPKREQKGNSDHDDTNHHQARISKDSLHPGTQPLGGNVLSATLEKNEKIVKKKKVGCVAYYHPADEWKNQD